MEKDFTRIKEIEKEKEQGRIYMNKKDFTQIIETLDGVPIMDEKTPFAYSAAAINALLATYQDEPTLSGIEKVTRFSLAQRIHLNPKEVTLSDAETQLIKDVIGKSYNALVTGQTYKMLDKE